MKAPVLTALALLATPLAEAQNPMDELANMPGMAGDAVREQRKYPFLPGELPSERQARVNLLKWKEQGQLAKTWTPALEAEFQKQMTQLSVAMSQRIAAERQAEQKTVIIERR